MFSVSVNANAWGYPTLFFSINQIKIRFRGADRDADTGHVLSCHVMFLTACIYCARLKEKKKEKLKAVIAREGMVRRGISVFLPRFRIVSVEGGVKEEKVSRPLLFIPKSGGRVDSNSSSWLYVLELLMISRIREFLKSRSYIIACFPLLFFLLFLLFNRRDILYCTLRRQPVINLSLIYIIIHHQIFPTSLNRRTIPASPVR